MNGASGSAFFSSYFHTAGTFAFFAGTFFRLFVSAFRTLQIFLFDKTPPPELFAQKAYFYFTIIKYTPSHTDSSQ